MTVSSLFAPFASIPAEPAFMIGLPSALAPATLAPQAGSNVHGEHGVDSARSGLSAFEDASTAGQLRRVVNRIRLLPGMRLTVVPHPEALLVAAREQRELARLHDLDLETGLANRRRWNRELREAKCLTASSVPEIAVLVLKLPESTRLRVLTQAAHQCAATLRPEDLVARLGHRQLGGLLRGISHRDALVVTARLREALDATELCAEGVELSLCMVARESIVDSASLCA
ncbi:MAG TPA: hypothetical protein VFG30_21385 [Polyangiales bacterium]|jgi:GGDEF domain-containing protein|nr:hypothetical protein [Polyangiales bacterium]